MRVASPDSCAEQCAERNAPQRKERQMSKTINSTATATNTSRQIVVLQRGWIVVGDVTQTGSTVIINNASVIRRWGTTNGLGQLALAGATKETILDPCGVVKAHELAIVMTIEVQSHTDGRPVI